MKYRLKDILKTNMRSTLAFLLLYRVLCAAFFWRLSLWGIRILLAKRGYAYLTQNNLIEFILHPWTIAFLILLILLAALAVSVETAVVFAGMWAGAVGTRLSISAMVREGVRRLRGTAGRGMGELIAASVVSFLVVNCYILYRLALHFRLARFMIEAGSGTREAVLLAGLVFTVLVILFLLQAFAQFSPLFQGEPFSKGQERSGRIMAAHGLKAAGSLAAVQVLSAVFYGLAYLAVMLLAALLLKLGGVRESLLAMLLIISQYVDVFLILVSGGFTVIFSLGLLTWWYLKYQTPTAYTVSVPMPLRGRDRSWTDRVLALAILLLAVLFAADMVHEIYRGSNDTQQIFSDIRITAHRGVSYDAPENTMEAVALAVENHADYVEIDVQETKDGVVILLHDSSLARTCGDSRNIWEVTWKELSQMDAGSWFSSEFAGARVPTLEQVFQEFGGQIPMNIEVKNNGHNSDLVGKVLEMIELYHMEEYVMISSTSYAYVKQIKESNDRIPVGLILSAAYGNFFDSPYIDFISIRHNILTREIVERAHEQGKEVHAWTVNTKGAMERMKRLGVDSIITDLPLLAREIIYSEETLENIADLMNALIQER